MSAPALKYTKDDAPFSFEPREAYTIPARYYRDPGIYEAEKEAIFYKSWVLVGHVSRFPKTGSYLRVDVHDQGILLVRGRDEKIRAFYNVCQHRGHELVKDDSGTLSNLMVCPYHAWAFDLEGGLVRARNTDDLPDFKKEDFNMKPVRVEEHCGFLYVNLDPDAEPIGDVCENMEAEMRHYVPRIDDLVFSGRITYNVKCNWKVLVDNFLECYHCHPAHPALVDLMDMDSYTTKTHKYYSSHIAEAPRTTDSAAYSFEKGDVDFGYAAWFLWPNLTIWAYPGEPLVLTLQMNPDGEEHTIEHVDCYTLSEELTPQLKAAIEYMDDVLQPEDIGLCESVQKGLRSKGYNQGRLVVDTDRTELSEHGVHHFHSLLMKAYGAEGKA